MKQLLSILILFCAFSGKAQYGAISVEINYDSSIKDHFLYKDSTLIPKDTLIQSLDDYAYFEEFVYDSLSPGKYTLIVYLILNNDDEYVDFYENKQTYSFEVKPDSIALVDFAGLRYNRIIYSPIKDLVFRNPTKLNEFLRKRYREGPEYGLFYSNRNWTMNSPLDVSLVGGRMGYGIQSNVNRFFALGFNWGIDLIYGVFNKSKTPLNLTVNNVKHQNYVQSNVKLEGFFLVLTPEKSYKDQMNPFALKLGLGYNLPIVNRYTVFYTAGEISRNRFFHKFNDAYTFVGLNFHAFKISAEYHPFDLFKSGYYELSPFRINIGFQILIDE